MKCEICHEADARKAIRREKGDGSEEELYVCESCASKEKARRQKMRQRTIKTQNGSITVCGDIENPPPILGAIISAVSGIVGSIGGEDAPKADAGGLPKDAPLLPLDKVHQRYRIGLGLHLEGLYLIGEIEACARAAHALGMDLVSKDIEGLKAPGHVYGVRHSCPEAAAHAFVKDLVEQEKNARARLKDDMAHVFADSLCRALAILKNCRLLSPAEYFDMLSTLRLAALEGFLDGMDFAGIEKLIKSIKPESHEDPVDVRERDREDAERAEVARETFEDVMLNEKGEEKLL